MSLITHAVSTLVLLILAFGLYHRHNTPVHVPTMFVAFAIDVILVLYIELNQQAIETVVDSVRTPVEHGVLLFHVGVSLLTILLYVALAVLGWLILRGGRPYLLWHGRLARIFIVTRLLNYVTSYMI